MASVIDFTLSFNHPRSLSFVPPPPVSIWHPAFAPFDHTFTQSQHIFFNFKVKKQFQDSEGTWHLFRALTGHEFVIAMLFSLWAEHERVEQSVSKQVAWEREGFGWSTERLFLRTWRVTRDATPHRKTVHRSLFSTLFWLFLSYFPALSCFSCKCWPTLSTACTKGEEDI